MPLPAKPTSKPDWTLSNAGVRVEPDSSYKNTGWFSNIRPPYQFMNWLFYICSAWINYFDSSIDIISSAGLAYDFSIGTGGTYPDINSAMADSAVVAGSRLLILNSLSLTTTQVVNKNNIAIDMVPGAVLTDGGAATGVEFSGTRCRIKGGKMSGFSVAAIKIDVAANYARVGEMNFVSNTTDINDVSGTMTSWGIINE